MNGNSSTTSDISFRPHQEEAIIVAKKIIDGQWPSKFVVADVTPGGGKSMMAQLFALELLNAGYVDRVFWLVPRVSLTDQVDKGWDQFRRYKKNVSQFCLEKISENNTPLYTKESVGLIATYPLVQNGPLLYVHACTSPNRETRKPGKTLVILDEAQFLANSFNAEWTNKVRDIVDAATVVLVMTGTIVRHDGVPIAFVNHEKSSVDERLYPQPDIEFSLSDAVACAAVKPIEFFFLDGQVDFSDRDGLHTFKLSEAHPNKESSAIRTFASLSDTYQRLIDLAFEHWFRFREKEYRSRIIVVAGYDADAIKYRDYIEKKFGLEVALCTDPEDKRLKSKDERSRETLRRFRENKRPDVLITVHKASVGLDVPDCTHMVYLSHVRSLPYAQQAFARVTRIDPAWSKDPVHQRAYIFLPDDNANKEIVAWVQEQQKLGIEEGKELRKRRINPEPEKQELGFIPLDSTPLDVRFDSQLSKIQDDDSEQIARIFAEVPSARSLPPSDILKILRFNLSAPSGATRRPSYADDETPSERKKRLKAKLDELTKQRDALLMRSGFKEASWGYTNGELKRLTGKSRDECDTDDLQRGIRLVQRMIADLVGSSAKDVAHDGLLD